MAGIMGIVTICSALLIGAATPSEIRVADAYARADEAAARWTIGTDAVEMGLECKTGKLRLTIFRNKLVNPATEYVTPNESSDLLSWGESNWRLEKSEVRQVVVGGRPAVQLDLVLIESSLKITYHVVAFPGTSILRQWAELQNAGTAEIALTDRNGSFSFDLQSESSAPLTVCWMTGANNQRLTAGVLHRESIGPTYRKELNGSGSFELTPWLAIHRREGACDGLFVALDNFFERWTILVNREPNQPCRISAGVPLKEFSPKLAPGATVVLPTITLGVFHRDLDDMAARLYAWQYEYFWDYTHDDWFAKMPWTVEIWYGDPNLQQQYAGRLARSDADTIDVLRECGMELLWNDAGWAADPNVWACNLEGPDYSESLRYCDKFGIKRIMWIPGNRNAKELDAKFGTWGAFQWRSDGVDTSGVNGRSFRDAVAEFLDTHPRSSFQTCSGGATYAHTFDWQRYGDIHYDTDWPEPEYANSYFSYLHLPDKWFDNLSMCSATRRRMIAMVPKYHFTPTVEEKILLQRIADLYHYLLQTGVSGRWSFVAHPLVEADNEAYYFERLNYDRRRVLIVVKHDVKNEATIFPRGLVPDHDYLIEGSEGEHSTARVSSIAPFAGQDVTRQEVMADAKGPGTTRTGRDLMSKGIKIKNLPAGTYIYLNLPDRPNSGRDKTTPTPPGRVLSRRETNLGHTGVMLYWSPGTDNNWISYYEVRRGEKILGRSATGLAFFDRSANWNQKNEYFVRTVDGDSNVSAWMKAAPIPDEPLTYAALGAHGTEANSNGWFAEMSSDGIKYQSMTWVPRAGTPTAEFSGNPNQIGGAEGYWEGAGARCGRGWQQASASALCARTWIAPQPGTVRITGKAVKEYYHRAQGGPLKIRIEHAKKQVWPAEGWETVPLNNLDGLNHDLTLDVQPGDAIRFVLDKGASPENDILAWMPRIEYAETSKTDEKASVVRILCGAKTSYKDGDSNPWSPDAYFEGGEAFERQTPIEGALPTPNDAELYRHGRSGKQFTYSIPVSPGLYSVRLKFAETQFEYFFERPFNVDINGRRVMRNFDICQAVRGPRKAYERVYRYVVPNENGRIVLHFSGGWEPAMKSENALVQAIEVLPEHKPHIRIDAGSEHKIVDWNGYVWDADSAFSGRNSIRSDASISQASPTLYDQELYRTARTGKKLFYRVPVPAGHYTVHLKFAELWLKNPGERPMNIEINGNLFRRNWDPATAAGMLNAAIDLRAEHIAPDPDGMITVTLTGTAENDAILQAIEVE